MRFTAYILVIWMAFATGAAAETAGVLDLSDWNTEADSVVTLGGPWLKMTGEIIDPDEIVSAPDSVNLAAEAVRKWEPARMPDMWGPGLTSDISTGHGLATYRLRIRLPEERPTLAIDPGTLRTVVRWSVIIRHEGYARVVPLVQTGDVTTTENQRSARLLRAPILLPEGARDIELVLALSNGVHKQGGVIDAPRLGTLERISTGEQWSGATSTGLVVLFFLMGAGALVVARTAERPLPFLIYAAMSIMVGVRVTVAGELIWMLVPQIGIARKYDFEYMTIYVLAVLFYLFVVSLLPRQERKWVTATIVGVTSVFFLFAAIFAPYLEPGIVTLLREPYALFGFFIAIAATAYAGCALVNREEVFLARVIGLSIIVVFSYEIFSALGFFRLNINLLEFGLVGAGLLFARGMVLRFDRVHGERDELIGRLQAMNKDLSDRAEEISRAHKEARQASQAKSAFLANMSHELRTPLNAIIGFSDIMRQQTFGPVKPDRYVSYVTDINEAGTHLLSVINDILDMSKVEANKLDLTEDYADLAVIAKTALRMTSDAADRRQIKLELQVDEDLPMVRVDERLICQIMLNLLSNAIKFSAEGGQVRFALSRHKDGGCDIQVSDQGSGISPENLARITDPFFQAESSFARREDGTGLGLTLVKAFAKAHGGTLTIESTEGAGTSARVHIPGWRAGQMDGPADPMAAVIAAS